MFSMAQMLSHKLRNCLRSFYYNDFDKHHRLYRLLIFKKGATLYVDPRVFIIVRLSHHVKVTRIVTM